MDNVTLPGNPTVYFKAPYARASHLIGASKQAKRKFLCVDNNWERLLFKYKKFDKKHLETFLVDSCLYMSDQGQLNDPFDIKSRIEFLNDELIRKEYLRHLFGQFKLTNKERRQIERRLESPEKIKRLLRLNLQKEISSVGVHSFASDAKSLLMWSHYADSHKGVCLVFDISEDINTFVCSLPVSYSKIYPTIRYHIGIGRELIQKAFLTKALDWAYEKERRIFDRGSAKRLLSFSPSALYGIILGANINNEHKAELNALLERRKEKGFPDLKIFQAKCSESEYKINIWKCSP